MQAKPASTTLMEQAETLISVLIMEETPQSTNPPNNGKWVTWHRLLIILVSPSNRVQLLKTYIITVMEQVVTATFMSTKEVT